MMGGGEQDFRAAANAAGTASRLGALSQGAPPVDTLEIHGNKRHSGGAVCRSQDLGTSQAASIENSAQLLPLDQKI